MLKKEKIKKYISIKLKDTSSLIKYLKIFGLLEKAKSKTLKKN